MNVPSQTAGNWGWRFREGVLTDGLGHKLAALMEVTDRQPR
jgi:hypothetical protein